MLLKYSNNKIVQQEITAEIKPMIQAEPTKYKLMPFINFAVMIMLKATDEINQMHKLILVFLNFKNWRINAASNPIITAGIVPSTIENTNGTENT